MMSRARLAAQSIAWAAMITAGTVGYLLGGVGKRNEAMRHAAALREWLAVGLDGDIYPDATYWPAPQVGDLVTADNVDHLTWGTVVKRDVRYAMTITLGNDAWHSDDGRCQWSDDDVVAWGDVRIVSIGDDE